MGCTRTFIETASSVHAGNYAESIPLNEYTLIPPINRVSDNQFWVTKMAQAMRDNGVHNPRSEADPVLHEDTIRFDVEEFAQKAYKRLIHDIHFTIRNGQVPAFWVFPLIAGCARPMAAFDRVVAIVSEEMGRSFLVYRNDTLMSFRLSVRNTVP